MFSLYCFWEEEELIRKVKCGCSSPERKCCYLKQARKTTCEVNPWKKERCQSLSATLLNARKRIILKVKIWDTRITSNF